MSPPRLDGVLLPAGTAWASVLQENPEVEIYDRDGAHPAPLGTYLAGITIYETLTGHDTRELSARAVVNGVVLSEPANTIRLLQEAAHSASARGAGPRATRRYSDARWRHVHRTLTHGRTR